MTDTAKRSSIPYIDRVKGLGTIPDGWCGWYWLPGVQGLEWVYYKNGQKLTTVIVSLLDNNMFRVWVANYKDDEQETISKHRKWIKAEEAALKFIRAHPQR